MKERTRASILKHKIIVIIRKVESPYIIPLAQALYNGGVRLIEVTFDQSSPTGNDDTSQAIRSINDYFGDVMCTGAGTVMTTLQAQIASDAGAKYLISPNTDIEIIQKTTELGLVSIPGAITPTEATIAYNSGADFVKLFPAGEMGIHYVKAIMAPLNHIPFLAVGGIDEANIEQFLTIGVKGFGIGSNIVKISLIKEGKFKEITELAKRFIEII